MFATYVLYTSESSPGVAQCVTVSHYVQFETNEDGKLMQYSEQWQADLQKLYPQRHYKASVIDVNGKNVFLTRYFKALNAPPEILEKSENDRLVSNREFVNFL